jgi:hypothetical protein
MRMSEPASPNVPTFHGNMVTMQVNTDDLTLEVREIRIPHSRYGEQQNTRSEVISVPALTPQEIYKIEPIVRVVLTFSAARALKSFLETTLPKQEAARRAGT